MTFCENLKKIRIEKGITQKEIAASVGVANSTYSLYESGKREPNVEMIKKIAQALNTTGNTLLGMESNCSETLNFEEQRLIENYRKMNSASKQILNALTELLAEK